MKEERAVSAFEIGYVISPQYCRKGYAFELIRGVIQYYFKNTDVSMLAVSCFIHNTASKQMLEKFGFTYEGIKRKGVRHEVLGPVDLLCYYLEK